MELETLIRSVSQASLLYDPADGGTKRSGERCQRHRPCLAGRSGVRRGGRSLRRRRLSQRRRKSVLAGLLQSCPRGGRHRTRARWRSGTACADADARREPRIRTGAREVPGKPRSGISASTCGAISATSATGGGLSSSARARSSAPPPWPRSRSWKVPLRRSFTKSCACSRRESIRSRTTISGSARSSSPLTATVRTGTSTPARPCCSRPRRRAGDSSARARSAPHGGP